MLYIKELYVDEKNIVLVNPVMLQYTLKFIEPHKCIEIVTYVHTGTLHL